MRYFVTQHCWFVRDHWCLRVVDHYITERLHIWLSLLKQMLLRSALSEQDWNWCQFGMRMSQKVCCLVMMMVYDEDALWKLASVSNKKQAAAVHCASPMPRSIWWSSMPCMAGAVHTQHLIRAQSGQTALLQSQMCKKRGKVRIKRRELMSLGHWFFLNPDAYS